MIQRCITLVLRGMVIVASCVVCIAQVLLPTKRLTVEHGLSQNSVQTLLQDKRGFMWFGTSDGLNRYDGYTFTVLRHTNGDTTTLPHSWIAALCETRDGMLWIGTAEGVAMLNTQTGRLYIYKHHPANPESIGADGVLSMMEDRAGALWIGMRESGLCKVQRAADGSATRFIRYTHNQRDSRSISNNAVWDMLEDRNGQFWLLTGAGLDLFDRTNATASHLSEFQTPTLTTLYQDRSGTMWIGTNDKGFFSFDPIRRKVLQHWQKGSSERGELTSNWVKCFLEDRTGTFWIGTQEGGLQTLDRTNGRLQSFNVDGDDVYGTGSKTVMRILEDHSGVLWFATNSGGLRKHSQFDTRFLHIQHLPHNPNSLSHNDVLSIAEDRFGALWIGTYGGGLNRYNVQTGQITTYKHQPNNPQSLGYDYIRALLEDEQGTLWVGTFGGGLSKAERDANGTITRWKRYIHQPDNPRSLSHNYIWALLETRNNGDSAQTPPNTPPSGKNISRTFQTRLWIGTDDGTVSEFHRESGTFTHHKYQRLEKSVNAPIQTLYQDRKGRIWVGTWGNGLLRLFANAEERNNAGLTNEASTEYHALHPTFYHQRIDTSNVAMMNVVSLKEDSRGGLWIGSYGAGLFRWDEERQTLMHFSSMHGLPNDVVYAILTDESGNLWISTNNGIAKITCTDPKSPNNPRSYTVRTFNISDGLQSNEFNRGAYCTLRDGRLAMGGVGGLNLFRPTDIRNNPHPPKVIITDFRKFNRPVPLDSSISVMSVLNLSYNDSFFSFDFAGLDYVNPTKHEYAYQLEGFDKTWIQAGLQRSVNYTNLDPGEYTFRVKAANGDGVWSPEGASIQVVIAPPFWKTWWFRLLSGMALGFGVWGVYRQRVRTFEKRNRELQHLVDERTAEIRRQMALLDEQAKEIQMVNVAMSQKNQALEESNTKLAEADSFKTRILSIAAHDLKNPLVSITGFSEIMLFDLTETNPHLPMVQAIARSSERMLDLINNILDASAIEMGKIQLHEEIFDFGYVCVSASESHQYAAELKSQTLHFNTDYSCMVRGDQKRLTQVADNLVSNAIKYSPSGADIRISVKKNHAFTRFSVQDQGPGLTNDDKEKLFGFFQRLSARPTGNESSNGVGLAIVKQIVELHGGRVWAESEYGQGSTFIVEMPLVQEGIGAEG